MSDVTVFQNSVKEIASSFVVLAIACSDGFFCIVGLKCCDGPLIHGLQQRCCVDVCKPQKADATLSFVHFVKGTS
jgi:hypothetical protein